MAEKGQLRIWHYPNLGSKMYFKKEEAEKRRDE